MPDKSVSYPENGEERLTPRALLRAGLLLLAVIAAAVALVQLHELVTVFLIAVVLAEGLRPLVDGLAARRMPREIARALVYVGLLAALAVVVVVLARPVVAQGREILNDLPRYQHELQRNLAALSLDVNLSSQLSGSAASLARGAFTVAAGLARGLVDIVVILLLSFLWLSASRRLGAFLLPLLPTGRRELALAAWREIAAGFAGYVRGVGVNMIVIGVLTGTATAFLGLPAPVLLGVLAGLTEMIPIVGPIIGAVPAVLLGFTISPYYPLLVAAVYLAIQQIEAHTLVPLVMRQAVGLPALLVVLALAAGAALGGVGGAIVAVPLAFAAQVVVLRVIAPAIRERNANR
jgi:predicted PurR-regulated permease PerM